MTIATQDTGATDNTTEGGIFDAADAFFKRIEGKGAEKLPEDEEPEESEEEKVEDQTDEEVESEEEETPTEDDSEPDGEETEETDEETEDEDPKAKKDAGDDVIVKIKVGDKEHEVPVKDLKRLYGQEAALTRKSQEVAAQRKVIEETGAKQIVALQTMLQRAQERAAPYAQLDFLAFAKDPNISAEELTALRNEAQRAYEDVNFYGQELDNVYKSAQAQRQQTLRTQAIEAQKVLSDPKTGIEGWSQSLYDDIRTFAIGAGLDASFVNEITDPAAIKILNQARLFQAGQKAMSQTTKVVKTPKKIMKTSSNEATKKPSSKAEKTYENLARTGSIDAAADLFLSRIVG